MQSIGAGRDTCTLSQWDAQSQPKVIVAGVPPGPMRDFFMAWWWDIQLRAAGELDGRAVARCSRMHAMPLTLEDLETVAQACRAMAHQEGQRAKAMENPTTRGPVEAAGAALRRPGAPVRGGGAGTEKADLPIRSGR